MNRILHGRKNVVGKQQISRKYLQLVEKCNSLHVPVSCVVQLIDFDLDYFTTRTGHEPHEQHERNTSATPVIAKNSQQNISDGVHFNNDPGCNVHGYFYMVSTANVFPEIFQELIFWKNSEQVHQSVMCLI